MDDVIFIRSVRRRTDAKCFIIYDRIELPPVRPDVTRVRLFGGRCACCGERAVAAAPAGLEPGSPFGKSIEAIAVYLHYTQAVGIKRLRPQRTREKYPRSFY